MPAEATLERPLPSNLDAERSVLGAILLDNNALNAAIENLRAEDFFLDQHRRVFTQMIALGESQQAIDLITLTEELHRRGDLEAAGGGARRRAARRTWRRWQTVCRRCRTSSTTRGSSRKRPCCATSFTRPTTSSNAPLKAKRAR